MSASVSYVVRTRTCSGASAPPVSRQEQSPNLKDIPGTLFLAGGAPVTAKGAPVAGVGVAGAPSGGLDEKYARAGAAALNK